MPRLLITNQSTALKYSKTVFTPILTLWQKQSEPLWYIWQWLSLSWLVLRLKFSPAKLFGCYSRCHAATANHNPTPACVPWCKLCKLWKSPSPAFVSPMDLVWMQPNGRVQFGENLQLKWVFLTYKQNILTCHLSTNDGWGNRAEFSQSFSFATLLWRPAETLRKLHLHKVTLLRRLRHDGRGTPQRLLRSNKACTLQTLIYFLRRCHYSSYPPVSTFIQFKRVWWKSPRLSPSIFHAPLSLETVPQTTADWPTPEEKWNYEPVKKGQIHHFEFQRSKVR